MNFREYIRKIISPTARVLEFGPLTRPIITKKENPNVYYADIRTTEEIKKFYTANEYLSSTDIQVDIDQIVEIDYVIKDSYKETFKEVDKFDFVILSHVIEHMPDIIEFFLDVKNIIKKNGMLIIIYPDKRYCFDTFRNEISLREALAVHNNKEFYLPYLIRDFYFNVIPENNPILFWKNDHNIFEFEKVNKTQYADNVLKSMSNDSNFSDVHFWPVTDIGFLKLLNDLKKMKYLDFSLAEFYPTQQNTQEFMVFLKKEDNDDTEKYINEIEKLRYESSVKLQEEKLSLEIKYNQKIEELASAVKEKNELELKYNEKVEELCKAMNEQN